MDRVWRARERKFGPKLPSMFPVELEGAEYMSVEAVRYLLRGQSCIVFRMGTLSQTLQSTPERYEEE